MSLLDKINQGFSQVTNLFSKQNVNLNPDLNSVNKTEQTNWFTALFNKPGQATPGFNQNVGLNRAAQNINLSNDEIKAQAFKESARLNQTSQTRSVKNQTWTAGANENGYLVTLKAKEVGMPRWGAVDPKAVSREAMEKAVVKMGITSDPQQAALIVDKVKTDGVNTWTTKGWRPVTAADYADKDWMNDRLDKNGNYGVQLGHDDIANILVASKEVLGAEFKKPANVSQSQLKTWGITITGGGLAASIALRGAPLVTGLGSGTAVAPVLLGVGMGVPLGYVTGEYLKEVVDNNLRRERTNQLPIPLPIPMTMEDAAPLPLPVPESKPKERPFAEPAAKPKVQDLPPAPTDLVPVPKTKPETTTAQPDAPPIDIAKNPQPYKLPRNNEPPPQTPGQPNSPKNLDRVIPPIIVGTAAGKAISDALKSTDLAPNGVEKISKREWTEAEYKQWFDSLPTKSAKLNTSANIYQLLYAGDTEYTVSGSGVSFDADGIKDNKILEAKYVGNPERSPYIEDSKLPDFLKKKTDRDTRWEFERMGKIIRDDNNPLTSVRVVANNPKSVAYFEKLMKEYKVPGEVILETKTDLEQ